MAAKPTNPCSKNTPKGSDLLCQARWLSELMVQRSMPAVNAPLRRRSLPSTPTSDRFFTSTDVLPALDSESRTGRGNRPGPPGGASRSAVFVCQVPSASGAGLPPEMAPSAQSKAAMNHFWQSEMFNAAPGWPRVS